MNRFSSAFDYHPDLSFKSGVSHSIKKISDGPLKQSVILHSKMSQGSHTSNMINQMRTKFKSVQLSNKSRQKDDKKDVIMRKLKDSYKVLCKQLKKATEQRDQALKILRQVDTTHQRLTQNYSKIMTFLEKNPFISGNGQKSAPSSPLRRTKKLKTVSSHNSIQQSLVFKDNLILIPEPVECINQQRLLNVSIQTDQNASLIRQDSPIPNLFTLFPADQLNNSPSSQQILRLQRQNTQLKQKLKNSEDIRKNKLASLRSIVTRPKINTFQ